MFNNIAIIGAGAMGTALSQIVSNNANNVLLFARREEIANSINQTHFNKDYFSNVMLSENIKGISDINELKNVEIIFLCIPSSAVRNISKSLKNIINDDCIIVNTAKGIENNSNKTMSQVIKEETGKDAVVFSGPNIAAEMVKKDFASTTIACVNQNNLDKVEKVLTTDKFVVSCTNDVIGTEYCGIIKNVIAISQGICKGMKLNNNAKFALFTKTFSETKDLIEILGGQKETVDDYCGFGDIITASTLSVSRNHTLGFLYGQRIVIDEEASGILFEGKNTIIIMKKICDDLNFKCLTVNFTYDVIIKRKNPFNCFKEFWNEL